ncbi:MAG: aquaporin [Puniceicoccales bacterium]|jgi:aquaporin Z|nr:aquaporin [Puniceicoccales bacterium]
MKKYIVEFIGTFFLVLTVACTAILMPGNPLTPLAIGSALMVMIYAGGHISGGHYNPAVTLGVWLRGRCDTRDVVPYVLAQIIGAAFAIFCAKALYPAAAAGLAALDAAQIKAGAAVANSVVPVILSEFLFTFALVYVVLNVATAKRNAGTGFYGLAIGFTVLVGAVAVGGISGGAFNPAVAVGVSLLKSAGVLTFATVWQHLAGEILAAIVAGGLFRALNADDK